MYKFSALVAICVGNSPVTGEFPAQRPVTRSFDVFFNLRHYNVTIMSNYFAEGIVKCMGMTLCIFVMFVYWRQTGNRPLL